MEGKDGSHSRYAFGIITRMSSRDDASSDAVGLSFMSCSKPTRIDNIAQRGHLQILQAAAGNAFEHNSPLPRSEFSREEGH